MHAQEQHSPVSVTPDDSLAPLRAELERRLETGSLELPL
jgi:hypothetical protein